MKKQIVKKEKFPNIFRFITERVKKVPHFTLRPAWKKYGRYWAMTPAIALSIAFVLTSIDTYHIYVEKQQALQERAAIQTQITRWEQVVRQYQDYRDGYFTLAVLEYQLGNKEKAQTYLKKTFVLDPNFEEAKKFEAVLNTEE